MCVFPAGRKGGQHSFQAADPDSEETEEQTGVVTCTARWPFVFRLGVWLRRAFSSALLSSSVTEVNVVLAGCLQVDYFDDLGPMPLSIYPAPVRRGCSSVGLRMAGVGRRRVITCCCGWELLLSLAAVL